MFDFTAFALLTAQTLNWLAGLGLFPDWWSASIVESSFTDMRMDSRRVLPSFGCCNIIQIDFSLFTQSFCAQGTGTQSAFVLSSLATHIKRCLGWVVHGDINRLMNASH